MPRVLCVWFPRWPIQRLRAERAELERGEVVLFSGQGQRLLVTVCGPRATRLGVRAGLPLAEARALMRQAHFLPADAGADREALRKLAADAHRFSPLVGLEEGDEPESLLCDVTGCTHLWSDEEGFVRAVGEYWQERGYRARLAMAGTVGAAWALARTSADIVLAEGDEAVVLSGLPARALRLPGEVLERLEALGLRTVGDVSGLPRGSLASRFGVALPTRLDQLFGRKAELFVVERPREPLAVVREWDEPIEDRLTIGLICREMLRELMGAMGHPGAGFQELEGRLKTEADAVVLGIRLARPSRDEGHLGQLVELELERSKFAGGVVTIRWAVVELGRLQDAERGWFGTGGQSESGRQVVGLIDRLSSRLGSDAVLRVEALPDAQPEHAIRLVPWTAPRTARGNEGYAPPLESSRRRPLRLLGEPREIEVVPGAEDGLPTRLWWGEKDRRVVRCWGPERIATGWWRAPDVQRDYYRAEWEDGTHAWVFRDLRGGRWFLHGFFE